MKASDRYRAPLLGTYLKVLRKNLWPVFIYSFVFLLIAVLYTSMGGNSAATSFEGAKVNTAFLDGDGGTPLTQGLRQYLAGSAAFVDVKTDAQSLQDALFFRNVEVVVRIPKGFTRDFLAGKAVKLDRTAAQQSAGAAYLDLQIDRYLNAARFYRAAEPGLSEAQLASAVRQNLALHAGADLNSYGSRAGSLDRVSFFFTYLVYAFFSILFLVVSSLMMVFGREDLRRRSLSSPLSPASMNLQLFCGHLLVTLGLWLCAVLLAAALYGRETGLGAQFLLFCLNALCLAVTALSISFLLGGLVKGRGAQNGIANVLSLGLCFISGVFIPQQYLGSSILAAARFTPSYWYVRAVSGIQGLVSFSPSALRPVLVSMAIQLGFAVAVFAIASCTGGRTRGGRTKRFPLVHAD